MEKPKEHFKNYEILSDFPEDMLVLLFSYLRKRDVLSVALTCSRFHTIFKRPDLREIILHNKSIDYLTMNNSQLQGMLFQRPQEGRIILTIARQRFNRGMLNLSMLRTFITSCPSPILYQFGRFLEFKNESTDYKESLLYSLLEKVVCSAEYYSGRPEYNNPHFISLVDSLGRLDIENPWQIPKLVENIFIFFQYAYLSLSDSSTEKLNLKELFDNYFVNNPDNLVIENKSYGY